MNKKIELVIKFFIGATFFVPLILLSSNFIFPFIVPKILIFRSIVLLMLGGYIILLISNWKKYRIRFSAMNIVVMLFFVSFAFSTFVGVDWYKSFWDNHERMLGLFTITHYILYYFVISSVVKEWRDWRLLLRVFLALGSVVMIIGVWQKFVDVDALLNRGNVRVSATLGNAIYFSGYGLFLFFIGFLLALKEKRYSFWQIYSVIGGLLGFVGVFIGGTRGTVLGLFSGFFVLCLLYIFAYRSSKKVRNIFILIVMSLVVAFGFIFAFRHTAFVGSIPAVNRLANISLSEGTGNTRLMAWGIAIDAWKERPVFGWGPNNFYYAFNKYYKPEFLELGWGETWFDNAHSALINTLAVQGIVGLISYIFLFGIPILVIWRKYIRERVDKHFFVFGISFLVAHFVHNAFVFENPTSYLYFFFFLAFLSSIVSREDEVCESRSKNVSAASVIIVIVFSLFFINNTNYKVARDNMDTLSSLRSLYSGENVKSIPEKILTVKSPHIDDIRNDIARTFGQAYPNYLQNDRKEDTGVLFDFVYGELKKNRKLHPLDIRVNIQQAQLAELHARNKQDISFIIEAESTLSDALKKSPKRQQLQYMLSSIKLQLGKVQEAVGLLSESIENDYKISEGWWRLALVYYHSGDIAKSQEVIEEAKTKGVKFGGNGKTVVEEIMRSSQTQEVSDTEE